MKGSINEILKHNENIANRLDQVEERLSWTEDKLEELLHSDSNKENKSNHYHYI